MVVLNQSCVYPSSSSQDVSLKRNKTVIHQRISKLIGMYPLGTMNISTNCYVGLQVDVELLLLTQKNVSSSREKRLIVSVVI